MGTWNNEVRKFDNKVLTPAIDWVKKEIVGKKSCWFDEYTGERARLYLELARLEIYNDMYYRNAQERNDDLQEGEILGG